jgi:hypothetical protein
MAQGSPGTCNQGAGLITRVVIIGLVLGGPVGVCLMVSFTGEKSFPSSSPMR